MSNFPSLKIIDVFRSIFTMFHVDYPVMRSILQVKLTMDARRVSTVFSDSAKKPKGNQFLKSLLIYALFGLLLIFFLFGDAYMLQMSLVFSIMMFLLMTAMIADFSSVLLDIRDGVIIGTKPVNQRTMNAAKLVHILIYMSLLTGAFAGIPFIAMLFIQGIRFALLLLFETFFSGHVYHCFNRINIFISAADF